MSATTASLEVPEASIRTGPTASADLAVVWARRAVTSSVLVMIVSLSTVDVTVGSQLSLSAILRRSRNCTPSEAR